MDDAKREVGMRTLIVFPEWGGREIVSRSIDISTELRERFRAWNQTWQVVLDPVVEISWPDPEVGREWIAYRTLKYPGWSRLREDVADDGFEAGD
jgi:hypothetical protein